MYEISFTYGVATQQFVERVCSEHNYDNKIKLISLGPIFLLLQGPQVCHLQVISYCWAKFLMN